MFTYDITAYGETHRSVGFKALSGDFEALPADSEAIPAGS